MKPNNGQGKERVDNEILFSRTVKAGKRIYYIDVKCDRHGEYYLAITESKRVKDGDESSRPVFEKHKIFLYREDVENFLDAFEDACRFALDGGEPTDISTLGASAVDYVVDGQQGEADDVSERKEEGDFRFDIDF